MSACFGTGCRADAGQATSQQQGYGHFVEVQTDVRDLIVLAAFLVGSRLNTDLPLDICDLLTLLADVLARSHSDTDPTLDLSTKMVVGYIINVL